MWETKTESIRLDSAYHSQPLAAYVVTCPQVQPRAVLQIVHGMAEYWLRYQPFAAFMARNGYVVVGHDHLGHGATSGDTYPDGFFAPKQGRTYVLQDLHTVTQLAHQRYPALPLILFGHSMGSFFARWAVETWPQAQSAAVFCGTGGKNPAAPVGIALSALISAVRGPQYCSKFINGLAFGSYQKRIADPKTANDWLSVNEQNVAAYIQDPKCGFPFTVSAMHEVMCLVQHVNAERWVQAYPKALPTLLMAGAEDPVGDYGSGPAQVTQRLRAAGVQQVQLKLYAGMRHEVLNETEKQTVWDELLAWCQAALDQPAPAAH